MLGFISLIFLNIHSIPINLNDSILSDTTAAVIDTIDSTSLMNDSFVIEEIKEAPIKIISFRVNSNQIYELSEENNIKINERDTLSLVLQINDKSENIIFNYYFNENPNFRIIENGKILFDKTSRRIYFDFIPNNDQAINKFLTWNVFINSDFNNLFRYDLLIEINNLEYPPRIVNKQIDKIIREKYNFNYSPIISDGGKNLIFDLQTNAPIDYFNPISGQIDWKIDPNNIKELEKIFEFKLKVYKQNQPELYDIDTFKIIYSENNFPPVFGKMSKWIVEEGKSYEYKLPVDDPNVNDSIVIENIGAQLPRGMKLDNTKKKLLFDVDYDHVEKINSTQNYDLQIKATDLSGLSSQVSISVVVMSTLNPEKVQEKVSELISELEVQQNGLDEINSNLKWIEATSKNNRKLRTLGAAGITFLGSVMGILSTNAEITRKAGAAIGASGAVLSVINEVLSRDDNEIKSLLRETIKLQSNVKVKYDRLSFYKNSQNPSDFQNQEIDLLIKTIENERESLNKNLFTISENYKIIISEKRIRNMLRKKVL
ncbi:MAG: hypothetical protein CMB88_05200 [Flammeovirgaceae bacterium]|nr:hypothetical protein [Flammeovirgaceae bacterium]|tara:strand:- start:1122 stop:2750 length:1629 start_codon:yes stop_codon:yes gene_type:complete